MVPHNRPYKRPLYYWKQPTTKVSLRSLPPSSTLVKSPTRSSLAVSCGELRRTCPLVTLDNIIGMLPQHFNADFYSNTSQFVNPGYSGQFSQNREQGPSASTSNSPPPQLPPSTDPDPPRKRQQRIAIRPKRKRGNSVGDDNADNSPGSGSGSAQGSQRTAPKKKKANRACFHCQKAHLTCDDCASVSPRV